MLKRLKIRMMLTTITLLAFVLLLVIGSMYMLMLRSDWQRANRLMDLVQRPEFARPEGFLQPGGTVQPEGMPDWHSPKDQRGRVIPELFTALVDEDGGILSLSENLRVESDIARSVVEAAVENRRRQGQVSVDGDSFFFRKVDREDGTLVICLDRSSESDMLDQLLLVSASVAGGGLLLVFFISWYLTDRSIRPVQRAWEKQKEFVADASHELRTPLAVISTNLDVLESDLADTGEDCRGQGKWLTNIRLETKRMARLVENLLFLARSDSEGEREEMAVFDFSRSTQETASPFEPLMAEKGLRFRVFIEPGIHVRGSEPRLRELPVILLDNAVKNTDRGSVELRLERSGENVLLSVSDTGRGIPPEHQEKIFERFYRVDKARSRQSGGYGLGLSIARQIAAAHQGRITVDSQPGQGARFTVTLPVQPPERQH